MNRKNLCVICSTKKINQKYLQHSIFNSRTRTSLLSYLLLQVIAVQNYNRTRIILIFGPVSMRTQFGHGPADNLQNHNTRISIFK